MGPQRVTSVCSQETLKLMGVSELTQTFAWFVEYLILMTITVIFLVICLNIDVSVDNCDYSRSPVGDTSVSVLMAFLFLYTIANLSFSFCLSSFFEKGEVVGCHCFQLASLVRGK